MGNLTFKYKGDGGGLFAINFVGILLTYITVGIYFFKYSSEKYNYITRNILLEQDGKIGRLEPKTNGMGMFKLMIGNLFITLFTLGLGTPWAIMRTINFYVNNTTIEGLINFDEIVQTETNRAGATGEGLMDSMDALDLQLI